jgi:pyruvate/2-oxoglutarate dehydrogenase complex dihydrolipoamide acyltransferase (E2) component
MSRRVEFRRADDARERWRAVGLVIATLVGESRRAAEEAPAAPAPMPSPPTPPPSAEAAPEPKAVSRPAPSREREIAWLDGGGVLDPGFGGWLHGGGWLRGALRPFSLPAFVLVAGRYAAAPTDRNLSQRWADVSAGVGTLMSVGTLPVRLELHVDAVAELLHAHATDPSSGATDASERWLFGGRAAAELAWNGSPAWALVGGIEANLLAGGTSVRVEGQPRGTDPAAGVGALLGARAVFH